MLEVDHLSRLGTQRRATEQGREQAQQCRDARSKPSIRHAHGASKSTPSALDRVAGQQPVGVCGPRPLASSVHVGE